MILLRSGGVLNVAGLSEQVEERSDPVSILSRVPEQLLRVHLVDGAAPGPGTGKVTRDLQVGHNGLHGAFGQPGDGGDVPYPGVWVPRDLDENVPVPGQQRPGAARLAGVAHADERISRATIIARFNT